MDFPPKPQKNIMQMMNVASNATSNVTSDVSSSVSSSVGSLTIWKTEENTRINT